MCRINIVIVYQSLLTTKGCWTENERMCQLSYTLYRENVTCWNPISYCMSAQVTQWSKAYDMDFTIILFISSSESKDQVRFSDPDLSVIHCCCKLLTFFTSSSEPLSLNFWKGVNVFLLLCWKRMWFHFKKLGTKHPWVKGIQVVTNE